MRPSTDEYFLNMARLVASRSTCISRAVGCVIVNRRSHVLATGYNGVAAGLPHCVGCVRDRVPGKDLELCLATHAEQNALLQCRDVYEIKTLYCTTAPCVHCTKLLLNTSCERIVFLEDYPGQQSEHLWVTLGGRLWEKR